MNTLTILLQAAAGGSTMSFWVMIIAMIAIMYFFMIRPQQKRQKEIQNFRNSLTVGQEVISSGGIYGKITHIDDEKNVVTLEIATGVKIKIDKGSIFANAAATQEMTK